MTAWIYKKHNSILDGIQRESRFLLTLSLLVVLAALLYPYPTIAMWLGFGIAGYSAIGNDSIQTLGTFISSNKQIKWWILWLFIGGILVLTHMYGWAAHDGDFSYGRLTRIPQPTSFTFLTLAAPIVLLVLTKMRMPVSTTFLLLSAFSNTVVIQKMLIKTFVGYIAAFCVAIVVWSLIAYIYRKKDVPKKYNVKRWRALQAASTSFLWCTWIMHDTANVAVFLPRSLSFPEALLAVTYLFLVVGFVLRRRGGAIQQIVTEKADITDVRSATMIDFVYAIVLLFFKEWNNLPMSTTWVFLGLLAGREIALTMLSRKEEPYKTTARLVGKDIMRASFGLLISLLIVLFIS